MVEIQVSIKRQHCYDILHFSLESKKSWKLHASVPPNTLRCKQCSDPAAEVNSAQTYHRVHPGQFRSRNRPGTSPAPPHQSETRTETAPVLCQRHDPPNAGMQSAAQLQAARPGEESSSAPASSDKGKVSLNSES